MAVDGIFGTFKSDYYMRSRRDDTSGVRLDEVGSRRRVVGLPRTPELIAHRHARSANIARSLYRSFKLSYYL